MESRVDQTSQYLQGPGYRIYHELIDKGSCDTVFNGVTLELCFFVFGSQAAGLIKNHGLRTTRAIHDVPFRRSLGISDSVMRRGGNPRDSRVLKKTGKTQLFLSPYVRDGIRRSPRIFEVLSQLYGTDKLAFTNGLDNFIYKAGGSEESPPTLDCKFFEPMEGPDGLNNPFHFVSLVCLSGSEDKTTLSRNSMETGSSSESTEEESASSIPKDSDQDDSDGSISILEGFDQHFEDIKTIIGPYGKYPITKKKNSDSTVLENFNLPGVNAELARIHVARSIGSVSSEFKPLRWVRLTLRPGDMIFLDCRIPYRTARNKTDQPVVFVPVSLRPVSLTWYRSLQHQQLLDAINNGKSGDWRKRTFKTCNLEEYTWRSKQTDIPYSALSNSTSNQTFSLRDQLIFGIKHYAF